MSEQIIKLPFFTEDNGSISYLDNFECINSEHKVGIDKLIDEGVVILKKNIIKGSKRNEKILVIEPHPDDFALSASGYALNALTDGATIEVMNIFSKTSVSKFPWSGKVKLTSEEYEKLRLSESKIAVQDYLGEKFESLHLPSPTLDGKTETFPKKYRQTQIIKQITDVIVKKVVNEKIDTVLCPMAIQEHIAHSISFDATFKAFKDNKLKAKLVLYEDFPYARNHDDYSKRLAKIKKRAKIQDLYIDVEKFMEIMTDLIIIYKSQFDDVNRKQMLAIIKEDFRAIGSKFRSQKNHKEFLQRYFEVKKFIK